MFRFFIGRLAVLIPTFLGVSIIAFAFIRLLPGDPVMLMSGERVMAPERHAEIMHDLGLDRPVYVQYLDYLGNLVRAISARRSSPSARCCRSSGSLFPATLELVDLRHAVCRHPRHSRPASSPPSSAGPGSTRG
jgi:dipeptide transport system permease protein